MPLPSNPYQVPRYDNLDGRWVIDITLDSWYISPTQWSGKQEDLATLIRCRKSMDHAGIDNIYNNIEIKFKEVGLLK